MRPMTEAPAPAPRWIDASENPFGVPLVDCRPVALGHGSWTQDPQVAERYVRLRSDSGERLRSASPPDAFQMRPGLTYPFTTARSKDGPVFRSSCMEEKWDVTWLSPYLYLSRSWTGDLVHKIEIEFADQRMFVSELLSAGDPSLAHDDLLAVRDADFLIKVLLY